MFKKLDGYIIKLFIGPFLFIFSILFFIFLVPIGFQKLDEIVGKGLGAATIAELIFYLGVNAVQLVLPVAVLLGSIMTFGGLGERYELAAMKSTGISLRRAMMPLFLLVCSLAIGLFFFADRVMPYSQEKAKNMLYNLIQTKPTLNFREGRFIEGIPGITLKVSEISGENKEQLKDIIIHINEGFAKNLQTIRAKNGVLASDSAKKHYLKLELYNGYIVEEERQNQSKKRKQPNSTIEFDTLYQYIDISELIKESNDTLGRLYTFLNNKELSTRIDTIEKAYDNYYKNIARNQQNAFMYRLDETKELDTLKVDSLKNYELPWVFEDLKTTDQQKVISRALANINSQKTRYERYDNDIKTRLKSIGKHKLHYQRMFSYAFTCIVFFLVGAPLGAIVKKGGIGLPTVISIIIFILYYIVNFSAENSAKSGVLDGHAAAWIANLIFFPLGIFLVIQANKDSDIFTSSIYAEKVSKFLQSLIKSNTYIRGAVGFLEKLFPSDEENQEKEHERYQ